MPPKKKNSVSSQTVAVDSLKHTNATRTNIPTEELRDFVVADETAPKTMRYPRNPDLDPQLIWKGKDEQDSADLEVPLVPIYRQEHIHPQALIEDVRASAKKSQPGTLDFFSDFNGKRKKSYAKSRFVLPERLQQKDGVLNVTFLSKNTL